MVDFGGMKDKAQDLAAEHGDKISEGVEKAGDFVGDKIGHDKVDPVEQKINEAVEGFGGQQDPQQQGDQQPGQQ